MEIVRLSLHLGEARDDSNCDQDERVPAASAYGDGESQERGREADGEQRRARVLVLAQRLGAHHRLLVYDHRQAVGLEDDDDRPGDAGVAQLGREVQRDVLHHNQHVQDALLVRSAGHRVHEPPRAYFT